MVIIPKTDYILYIYWCIKDTKIFLELKPLVGVCMGFSWYMRIVFSEVLCIRYNTYVVDCSMKTNKTELTLLIILVNQSWQRGLKYIYRTYKILQWRATGWSCIYSTLNKCLINSNKGLINYINLNIKGAYIQDCFYVCLWNRGPVLSSLVLDRMDIK